MTDPRADALTAPTADPGIVAALVYVGDQIAAIAHQTRKTGPRADLGPEREPVDPPHPAGPVGRRTGPHAAQHPIDRHLLPKEDR